MVDALAGDAAGDVLEKDTTGTTGAGKTDAGAQDAALTGGEVKDGAEVQKDGAGAVDPSKWPEDWRERFAGKDDKLLGRLKRFASPENVLKSYLDLEKRMSGAKLKTDLPDDATPEQLASWRKENGVPEKPDGYEVEWPKDYKPSDTDKAELGEFQAAMLQANVPAGAVKAAFAAYTALKEKAAEGQHEKLSTQRIESAAELRSEYGRDYKRNVGLADNFIAQHTSGKGGDLATLKLADGTVLGENPAFVRFAVNAALAYADDETMLGADGGSGGKAIADQYKELLAMGTSKDPAKVKEYRTEAVQKRLHTLREAMNKRGEK